MCSVIRFLSDIHNNILPQTISFMHAVTCFNAINRLWLRFRACSGLTQNVAACEWRPPDSPYDSCDPRQIKGINHSVEVRSSGVQRECWHMPDMDRVSQSHYTIDPRVCVPLSVFSRPQIWSGIWSGKT